MTMVCALFFNVPTTACIEGVTSRSTFDLCMFGSVLWALLWCLVSWVCVLSVSVLCLHVYL